MGSATGRPRDLIGREIAGYRLERVLGRGASGAVFLGRRVSESVDGPDEVAIKILLLSWELDDEERAEFRARFMREAETLRRLRHPHILSVLDVGEQDGLTYMVLPYLGDDTLAKLIAKRGPLPLADVNRYASQLAEALDYAHSLGIIHRDVKPQNVLLDGQGNAYLADFSIARLLEETRTKLTNTSRAMMGTPAYMAPEQITSGRVDAAADVYSLGVVIFELVTGQAPFDAANFAELIRKQTLEAPPNPQSLRPDLPAPAAAVILKALSKNPADREASATTFAQALAIGLQGVWPQGVGPELVARQPTDYSILNQPTTMPGANQAPMPGGARRTATLAAIGSLALVVLVLAALLFAQRGNGGNGVASHPTNTPYPPTITVGPGTPTAMPNPPTPISSGGGSKATPTATPIPPTPTPTPIPYPSIVVSIDPSQSSDGQAHGAGNPYNISLDTQYNNFTVQSGAYASTVAHCSGGSGAIRFTAGGTVEIDGTVKVDGAGYCGGPSLQGAGGGQQGESYTGAGGKSSAPNGGGGGGGDTADSGGGGGGYGSAGQQSQNDPGVFGGNTYGDPTMATIYLGSGGGSSGAQSGAIGGAGGNGGGSISIHAGAIVVTGSVSANGTNGLSMLQTSSTNYRGGGGGSIFLHASTVSLGNGLVTATGGTGGYGIHDNTWAISGGNGGVGRIRVEYTQTVSGTTNPAASVAHV